MLAAKKSYFIALAEYHQSLVATEKGGYGEQVFRLKVSKFWNRKSSNFGSKQKKTVCLSVCLCIYVYERPYQTFKLKLREFFPRHL